MAQKRKEMSGLFDIFRSKPQSKSLIPAEPKRSLVEVVRSRSQQPGQTESKLIEAVKARTQLPARRQPEASSLPALLVPKEPTPERRKTDWGSLMPGVPPQELRPLVEELKAQIKETRPSRTKYIFVRPSAPPQMEERRPYEMIALPEKSITWQLPGVEQLAEHFQKTNDLEGMWNYLRDVRALPEYRPDQLAKYMTGQPMVVPLLPIVKRERYTDFANFYGIPWGVMEHYLNVPPETEKAAEEALWADVISPLNIMVPEAFELLKPDDIPGFFNVTFVEPSQEHHLVYVEPLLGIGGPSAP